MDDHTCEVRDLITARAEKAEAYMRMYRNLLALAPYGVPVQRVTIPRPRPANADTVPLFPRRQKAGGHL